MKNSPIKAIREKCRDCMCGQIREIDCCPITDCSLWPYRFGVCPKTARKMGKDIDHVPLDEHFLQKKQLSRAYF
jgi:hypothetical protein